MEENRLGIIGCGNMGEAIARGVVNSDIIDPKYLYLNDVDGGKSYGLKEYLGANLTTTAEDLVNHCDTILLAVKPQDMDDLLKDIWHLLDSSKLVITIAAGMTIRRIKEIIREDVRVVRVMPNMAALVNQSVSALCYDKYATTLDKDFAKRIFKSIGDIVEVEEVNMDAVTAISGSGPAYFFYLIEMLEKSAVDMGIDSEKARFLAIKTALGSALLLKDSGIDAEALRKRVTSKGGTTEAAFDVFQNKKLGEILQEGIKAAKERSKELSKGI